MSRWCHLLLFLRQVGESGKAVGVEHIEELVNESMAMASVYSKYMSGKHQAE